MAHAQIKFPFFNSSLLKQIESVLLRRDAGGALQRNVLEKIEGAFPQPIVTNSSAVQCFLYASLELNNISLEHRYHICVSAIGKCSTEFDAVRSLLY